MHVLTASTGLQFIPIAACNVYRMLPAVEEVHGMPLGDHHDLWLHCQQWPSRR